MTNTIDSIELIPSITELKKRLIITKPINRRTKKPKKRPEFSIDLGNIYKEQYNSLTDKSLSSYFKNCNIQKHLIRMKLINRNGNIIEEDRFQRIKQRIKDNTKIFPKLKPSKKQIPLHIYKNNKRKNGKLVLHRDSINLPYSVLSNNRINSKYSPYNKPNNISYSSLDTINQRRVRKMNNIYKRTVFEDNIELKPLTALEFQGLVTKYKILSSTRKPLKVSY